MPQRRASKTKPPTPCLKAVSQYSQYSHSAIPPPGAVRRELQALGLRGGQSLHRQPPAIELFFRPYFKEDKGI